MLRAIGSVISSIIIAVLVLAPHANAQPSPFQSKPINIILALGPGTGMDTLMRLYGERLSQKLGRAVVIDNRPGASQMIAANAVASAPADGHTLLVATSGAMAINPTLFKQLTYDPGRDFVPLALYAKSAFILVASPAIPVRTVPEFLKYVREAKVPPSYMSVGSGSPQHLSMEFVKHRFGLNITHVPYRASGQALTDTAAGHVNLGFGEAAAALPLAKEGKLNAIAVSSAARMPLLPDVPTLGEAADAPDFEAVSWHAILAPAQTPKEIVDILHKELQEITTAPELKQRVISLGLIPVDIPSIDGLRAYIKSEQQKWGALVKAVGLEGSQ
jgi:tripartite-type tricarboxylate transporter receptor subunit TctC